MKGRRHGVEDVQVKNDKKEYKARASSRDAVASASIYTRSFRVDLIPHCFTGSIGRKLPTINDGLFD